MGIEDNTFRLSPVSGDAEYGLYADDDTANLTFEYATWVNTGGRENRIGLYQNGEMYGTIPISAIDATQEELDEIILS